MYAQNTPASNDRYQAEAGRDETNINLLYTALIGILSKKACAANGSSVVVSRN